MRQIDWREHIHWDPAVLAGKPVVRNSRLGVEFLLGLFAAGWTSAEILESYPQLTPETLRSIFAFAAESLREPSCYAVTLRGR
ncbi:DUF433 domain-containing protein [Longimicrobium sp.]|jgi:uncharacterized protein (DUF433 family)|uniref:DUF433 domain-containing protein n=1 Tax=Longimicrobium sp. TaxID=2029185 RepID=UPI0032C23B66